MAEIPKIVRQRMAAQNASAGHPDADVLSAFAEQRLSKTERVPVMAHLAQCSDCREIVALAAPAVTAGQPVIALVKRAWWSMPAFQYGAAAAAVAAVAVGLVLLQNPTAPQRSEQVATLEAPKTEAKNEPAIAQPETRLRDSLEKTRTNEAGRGIVSDRVQPSASGRFDAAPAQKPAEPLADAKNAILMRSAPAAPPSQIYKEKKDQAADRDVAERGETTLATQSAMGGAAAKTAPAAITQSADAAAQSAPASTLKAETKATVALAGTAPVANAAEVAHNDSRAADELAVGKSGPAAETQRKKMSLVKAFDSRSPWRINAGRLQHFDGATSAWNDVNVSSAQRLSVVGNLGSEVWVGGADGRMFYSNDQGAHWIATSTGGWSKDATFTGLTPTALRSVEVHLSNGERWRSADGGASWTRYQ